MSTPEEIADRCVEIGCPCCGLTDHGVVTGHLHFAKALEAKGVKPIFGCELYHGLTPSFSGKGRDQAHLIALAKTDQGLQNLWRLVNATARPDHFHQVGRVFWEDIEAYHEGIIFTSACGLGLVPKSLMRGDLDPLNRYLDIIGDDFYIELSTYDADKAFEDTDSDGEPLNTRVINTALAEIAYERGIPVVYGDDGHYAFPWQYEQHDMYLAVQTRQDIYTSVEDRSMWHPPGAVCMKDEATVRQALSYLPESVVDEAIGNAVRIGEMAVARPPQIRSHMPLFVPSECPWLDDEAKTLTPEAVFIDLVIQGIYDKYGPEPSEEVWERTAHEVEVLINDGIHHYFLMGWDEVQIANQLQVERGPGRGSSAGCIVAYALDITDADPLHYGLIFERFWNSGRTNGFPDIDSDFSRARRSEMIEALRERYGHDKVVAIGTTGYLKPKAVIDKLRGGCGITYEEADELKGIVGKTTKIEILGPDQIGWSPELEPGKVYYVERDCGEEIKKWVNADRQRRQLRENFIAMCEITCSRVEQYGIHASGIAILDEPYAPIAPAYMRGGKKGIPATMFDMETIDKLKIVKLDVLGLRTLDVLEFWRQSMIEEGVNVKWSGLDLKEHPQEMWDMLRDGYTAGIFQVEDGYGKQLCKQIEPQSVEDLSVINALNRPGPIQAGIPDRYIARRRGDEPVTYTHPRLEELLGEILGGTYGLFVYQEQIIAFFNALGYTLSESDAMRKIMGKKKPEQLNAVRDGLDDWEGRGYFTMAEAAGIPHDIAEGVWKELEGFADYCFNKSHTVAYAILTFRTLYAKYYGAGHFYAASMRSLDHSSDGDKRKAMVPQYVNECRRQGITVLPPDIMQSQAFAHYDLSRNALQFGFYDIKGVGSSGEYLVKLRRWDGFDWSNADAFRASFEAFNTHWAKERKEGIKLGQIDPTVKVKSPKQLLQANKIDLIEAVGAWPNSMTMTERQKRELEHLGVIVSDNVEEVLERNAEEIARCDTWDDMVLPWATKQAAVDEELEYLEYTVCGIVVGITEKRARKSGKAFGIVTLEYGSDTLEVAVWSNRWSNFKRLFKIRTPGIFTIQHRPPSEYGESYHVEKAHVIK